MNKTERDQLNFLRLIVGGDITEHILENTIPILLDGPLNPNTIDGVPMEDVPPGTCPEWDEIHSVIHRAELALFEAMPASRFYNENVWPSTMATPERDFREWVETRTTRARLQVSLLKS